MRLEGMNQISDYIKRSDATVLSYIRCMEFPAVKLGSIWVSDTKKIDEWFEGLIETGNGKIPAVAKVNKKTKRGKLKKNNKNNT